jgi:hypothetical protein
MTIRAREALQPPNASERPQFALLRMRPMARYCQE